MIFILKKEFTTKTSGFIIPKATSTTVTIERNINTPHILDSLETSKNL
jgi:hypothetical protein